LQNLTGSIFDISGTGYSVLNDTAGGQALMNAWTGSTIEGVSGVTKNDARWQNILWYGCSNNWWNLFFGNNKN
jgi:hypothetical protein